jgi:hypothetical protein
MHAPSFRRICWTYHSCCLIAVAICEDPWYRITRDAAQEAVGRRLEIPQGDVVVDFFPPQGFLLLLPEPVLRDRALSSNGGLAVGRAKLQLLPWMRKAGAEAAKLPFRVRLCIEGLPPHARREEIVRKLLPQATLFEGFDRRHRSDGEARQETAYACGSVGDGCGPVRAAGTRTAHPPLPSLAMSANACNTTNSIFAMNLLRDACA